MKVKIFSSVVGVDIANAPSLRGSCDFPEQQNPVEALAKLHSLFAFVLYLISMI
jgi:hypothetical protein